MSSFVLAFCGLTYELVFAQSLSIMLGNSILQYSATIGIFLAALGFGAMYARADEFSIRRLHRQQFTLALLAPAGLFALWLCAVFLPATIYRPLAYATVAGIGFLTGSEIPFLMQIGGENLRLPVLAADYFGMLLASVTFPLLLLPVCGVFTTVLIAGLFNVLVLLLLSFSWRERSLALSVGVVLTALFIFQPGIREWMSDHFINSAG